MKGEKMSLKEAIKNRRSVRTFSDTPVTKEDLELIVEKIKGIKTPFGLTPFFKILDKKNDHLSSPVITGGDNYYIGAKTKPEENWELAYGYAFGELCLLLEELGIGTTIIGGTFNRKAFEKAMNLTEEEIMPLATPIGYVAQTPSVREKLMRKAVRADKRLDFESIYYKDDFNHSLSKEEAVLFSEALDLMRLSPSAVNKQPWRVVLKDGVIHFYKYLNSQLSERASIDVQKIDVGIALATFDLAMMENGYTGEFFVDENSHPEDESMEYQISYRLKP